jgi:hypothetical protein
MIPMTLNNPWDENSSSNTFRDRTADDNPYAGQYISLSNASGSDRFSRDILNEEKPSPFFPGLSKYHSSNNYSLLSTGDQYIAESWYFENYAELNNAEKQLYPFLLANGNISWETIDFYDQANRTDYYSLEETLAFKNVTYPVTTYESRNTSGYFIVAELQVPRYSGYYITYWGIVGSPDLKKHSSHIKVLMFTRTPTFSGSGAKIFQIKPI